MTQCQISIHKSTRLENALKALVKAHVDFLLKEESFVLIFHQVRGLLQLKQGISANLKAIYGDYLLQLANLLTRFLGRSPHQVHKARTISMSLASYSTGLTNHHRLFHKKLNLSINSEEIQKRIFAALV